MAQLSTSPAGSHGSPQKLIVADFSGRQPTAALARGLSGWAGCPHGPTPLSFHRTAKHPSKPALLGSAQERPGLHKLPGPDTGRVDNAVPKLPPSLH